MTYDELWLYVNNQYVNAAQNNLLGTDIVIPKEDYFSLFEICNEQDIRCAPFILGFNAVMYDYTEDEETRQVQYSWLEGFDAIEDEYDKIDVRLYEFAGYYGNVFSVKKYFRSCMDPLNLDINREIFNPDMPVLTKGHDTAPTKYNEGCKVKNSLIPAGCTISGTVEDSVLFRNVVVEEGAVLGTEDSTGGIKVIGNYSVVKA